MFQYAFGFLLGFSISLLVQNTSQAIILGLIAILLLVYCLAMWRKPMPVWILLGIVWASINVVHWSYNGNQLIDAPKVAVVEGQVCSIPFRKHRSWRFDFCVTQLDKVSPDWLQRNRLKVTWGQYAIPNSVPLKAGQKWLLEMKVRPIHGRINPEGFDFERWMLAEGYAGSASVRKFAQILGSTSDSSSASLNDNFFHKREALSYQGMRQGVFDHLDGLIPNNETKPLLMALLMGERSSINERQWEVFQLSGTSHLLAISGLHVGIAAMWSYWLVFFLCRLSNRICHAIPAQTLAEIGALVGASTLVILSGFGLPAQRALIMLTVFLVSRWRGKHYRLINLLGIAAIIMVILSPFSVLSASFWLSFTAVLIIAFAVNQRAVSQHKWREWFKVNIYLYVALIPLTWMFFGSISWVAILANLVLIPVASFLLTPALYLGALLSVINESGAMFFFSISSFLAETSFWLQTELAILNPEALPLVFSLPNLVLVVIITFVFLLPRELVSRAILLPLGIALGLQFFERQPQNTGFKLWVFDVGQGLAVYLETAEGNLMFDAGWGNKDYASIDSSVVPFLSQRKVETLNKVIISHADTDHRGGLKTLESRYRISMLLSGETSQHYDAVDCHTAKDWQWSQVRFEFLKHRADENANGNNSSCVLSINYRGQKILLTGDIEKSAERRLIKSGVAHHQLIVAPHHGSNTSSTRGFLKVVRPQHVIFSTGFDNQWGFPKESVVERYKAVGAEVWVTHLDGAIEISVDTNGQLNVKGLRKASPRFWR